VGSVRVAFPRGVIGFLADGAMQAHGGQARQMKLFVWLAGK
jgi:hypothetical protein